jgi:hypothetical protein
MSELVVDFMDEVKSKLNDTSGVVNAIYTIGGITYVDVKTDKRIYYQSPVTNWEVVKKCDE